MIYDFKSDKTSILSLTFLTKNIFSDTRDAGFEFDINESSAVNYKQSDQIIDILISLFPLLKL